MEIRRLADFKFAAIAAKLMILLSIATTTLANKVELEGIFSQYLQPMNDAAYDDSDNYVPYRSDQHDNFTWSLLKEILPEGQENVIVSPFSVKLVLALLSEAAGNNTQTQKELYSTLTDIRSQLNLRSFYKKILTSLKKENPHYTLNLETKLYVDEFIEPQQKYAAMMRTFYDTDVERLRFADSKMASETINRWCSNVTSGRLLELVTEDSIKSSVILMANALYFKGIWRRQFNDSYQGVFFKTPDNQLKVDFMEQTEYFYYYESATLDARILRLPYKGKKFSMFILLPSTKAGLDKLIIDLKNDELKQMQWMMEPVKVKVTLPKFKFDFQKNIKEPLEKLGIQEIFTDKASLPGLSRGGGLDAPLKVSNIFQKAGIEVNERGTEAFASTVVEIENKFGGSSIVEFNVNRPFLFFIEDESSGSVIFSGKVLNPIV